MKPINLFILLICVSFSLTSRGQELDSFIYDLINLRGQNDRNPEFYQCNTSEKNIFNNKLTIDFCLIRSLRDLNGHNLIEIERVSKISEFELGLIGTRCASGPNIKYSSIFKIYLDKLGNVNDVETFSHGILSISEEDLKVILSKITWKAALKDLNPVASKFAIEIIYENSLCHQETWAKRKQELYSKFPNYRKELMSIYLNNGVMWEDDILIPMMKFQNEKKLSQAFDKVEKKCNLFIDSLNMEFNRLSGQLLEFDCQKSYDIVSDWYDQNSDFMYKTLKAELVNN